MSANNQPYDWANPPESLEEVKTISQTHPKEMSFWSSLSPVGKAFFTGMIVLTVVVLSVDIYWAATSPPMVNGVPNESFGGMILFFALCYGAVKVVQKLWRLIQERVLSLEGQRKIKNCQDRLLSWLGFEDSISS